MDQVVRGTCPGEKRGKGVGGHRRRKRPAAQSSWQSLDGSPSVIPGTDGRPESLDGGGGEAGDRWPERAAGPVCRARGSF